ncbi:MAG: DNA polymerase IV [Planctomycetota bacterium]|nr:DNA polymerase IV [Planctomycetota bacterium]
MPDHRDSRLPAGTRRILHVDVDAFLASVESAVHPELRGKPLVIGGSPDSRNIVMSSSYEARAFGIRPGIHLSEAKRRCPQAIFRKGDAQAANRLRAELTRLLLSYTPKVAVTSIDDFLVDLTDTRRLFGAAITVAEEVRRRAHAELHLPLSIGIGTNPLLARLAGKLAKPGKIAELLPGLEDAWLRNLPASSLPGVGHAISRHLGRFSIHTVGDLRAIDRELLFASFGRPGLVLYERSRGIDDAPVEPTHRLEWPGGEEPEPGSLEGPDAPRPTLVAAPPKSIRRESTFEPEEARFDLVEAMLAYLVERAAERLRAHNLVVRSAEVSLRYVDTRSPKDGGDDALSPDARPPAKTLRKRRRLRAPTDATLELIDHARTLLDELPRRRALVKRVGIGFVDVAPAGGWQGHLFDDLQPSLPLDPADTETPSRSYQARRGAAGAESRTDRHRRLDTTVDALRHKLGFGRIVRGSSMPLIETTELGEDGFELRTPSLNQ